MADNGSRSALPAIVTSQSDLAAPPVTPPRPSTAGAGLGNNNRAATASNTLTPPVFVVTPSQGDDGAGATTTTGGAQQQLLYEPPSGRSPTGPGAGGLSSTLAPLSAVGGDSASTTPSSAFPPSPTLTQRSIGNNGDAQGGHFRKFSLTTPQRKDGEKGHSPTKSVDSSFKTYLDVLDEKKQKDVVTTDGSSSGHGRRPSATTDLSAFTAIDGPRASDNVNNPSGARSDIESGIGAAAGGPVVKNRKIGFLAKIPLIKRFARTEPVLEDDDDSDSSVDEKSGKKGKKDKLTAPKVIPDPSPEQMGVFPASVVPSSLYKLISPKSMDQLRELGGQDGLMEKLRTDPTRGLSESAAGKGTTIDDRREIWGENKIPARKPKTLLQLMWIAYQDKILILLTVAAVVSLALGIYQSEGAPPQTYASPECPNNLCEIASVEWVEGVAIVVAIVIIVMVGAVNDYQKELQFRKLNAQSNDKNFTVIRDGKKREVSVFELVVGDVCAFEPGAALPTDGIFLSGHNVQCDESSATGESDNIKKLPYSVFANTDEKAQSDHIKKADCFMLSGAKVVDGSGMYVVTGVGQQSFLGRIMTALRDDEEDETPLQLKLNRLANWIAYAGAGAGLLLFTALMIRFFTQLGREGYTSDQKAQSFIHILIIAVTVVVVAVPEGLPLAVTLALAFATTRMTKQNLLVRQFSSCETMGTATVVCTDKTGTLTQNRMTVVAGAIGVHLKFAERLEETHRTNANSESTVAVNTPPKDFSRDINDISQCMPQTLQTLLNDAVVACSDAYEGLDGDGKETFFGSKTEVALLEFAKRRGWPALAETKAKFEVVNKIPFASSRKSMSVIVKNGKGYRLYIKGASEILAKASRKHIVSTEDGASASNFSVEEFDEYTRNNTDRTIIYYANQSLRTIAVCYRDFEQWPPANVDVDDVDSLHKALCKDLTLVAITAIEDPLRVGVIDAVKKSQGAGVAVKMCTGDNVLTARSIAKQCGIWTEGGLIMEGPQFHELGAAGQRAVCQRLQVLARCSPTDKADLVRALRSYGEVVGVTGDGANDAPALKAANVGFSMGIAGTEVAKEASAIVLMDDNFASIVTAISWGRCVNDSVRKFLQFQISVNITAVLLTFITAVSSNEEASVITAVQLLWVNLIMDTFAALALATDPADPENLKRKPDRAGAPLISCDMWKMIIGQSIFQLAVTLVLNYAGNSILGYNATDEFQRLRQQDDLKTLIFNSFVFCQIFNMLNARKLDRSLNVFRGFWRNYYFMAIFVIMVGGQALIVNVGGRAFQVTRIGGNLWAISIIIGLVSLPIGVIIRLIPTAPVERAMIRAHLLPDPNALPTDAAEKWDDPLEKLRDNLRVYSRVRGGRLRSSSIVQRSRTKKLEEQNIYPTTLMATLPSVVAAAIGGGFRPEGSLANPAAMEPSRSSTALYRGEAAFHPDTQPNDPMAKSFLDARRQLLQEPSTTDSSHLRAPSVGTIPEESRR